MRDNRFTAWHRALNGRTFFGVRWDCVPIRLVGVIGLEQRSTATATRLLTLLSPVDATADLTDLLVRPCTDVGEFHRLFDAGDYDIAVFDLSLCNEWPTEAANALSNRSGRRRAIVLLFDHANDARVVEDNTENSNVWCIVKDSLVPSDLTTIVEGLAALVRVRARSRTRN